MSFQSMTGFGRMEMTLNGLTAQVEIKSVNHRFKDFRFRMPSSLNVIELEFKKILGERFKRGSFDIFVFLKKDKQNKFDNLDLEKVESYLEGMKEIAGKLGTTIEVRPTEFLRPEFLKEADESENEKIFSLVKSCFDKACEKLEASRVEEGQKLIKLLESHRNDYFDYFKGIEDKSSEFEAHVKERLLEKFNDLEREIKIDEPRYLQEVVYYLEKMDVHEEIGRIHSHLQKLDNLLQEPGEIGRQMEFVLQELNRETNTIGSKSAMEEISARVVKMKVQLEKLREQSLNLE